MTEPHPLRCETCKKENCPLPKMFSGELKMFVPGWMFRQSAIVGCASHSSAKGDAVLEELYEWASSWHKDTPIRDVLLKKIAEFRQQQEREQG